MKCVSILVYLILIHVSECDRDALRAHQIRDIETVGITADPAVEHVEEIEGADLAEIPIGWVLSESVIKYMLFLVAGAQISFYIGLVSGFFT